MNNSMAAESASYGMNTVITNKVFGEHVKEALRAAEEETARLEGMLSRFIPGSDISRLSSSAGIRREKVSPETHEIISRAIEFSKYSGGCFDVTIGPLVDLWRSAKHTSQLPDKQEIMRVLRLVDYTDIVLDPAGQSAGLGRKGQSIDLGGIAKGFAAEKIMQVFRRNGITSAFTNFGGNVVTMGTKPDGSSWRVGIQHPRNENNLIGAVSVTDKAVVTSGDYQRYFTGSDGKRYHHLLDPDTGYPSESGLISVTIVTDDAMAADALSTMIFIAGMDKGAVLLKSLPGTEAVLIDKHLAVTITPGLKDSFQASEDIDIKILNIMERTE